MAKLADLNRVATAGELTAAIAHEVSQPLAAMVTNANAGLRWLNNKTPISMKCERPCRMLSVLVIVLGRVDGFDQDEAESKRDERAVILRRLLASKCNTLEALELADRLFDACPRLVECFWKEGGHVFGVGSIRDCRAYSALACGLAI